MWGDPILISGHVSASDSNDFGVGFALFSAFFQMHSPDAPSAELE